MNIFKSIIQSIKLKLYLKIAKRNLRIIQEFEKQKEHLNEIMTTYKVENKLVELKAPKYNYYKAYTTVSVKDALEKELSKTDIPEGENIKVIDNPLEILNEGYYCIVTKKEECFAFINNEKHPLEQLGAGLPYKEIFDEKDINEDGYYKKYTITKKYYHAENSIALNNIELIDIPEEEKLNIKLVEDTSCIDKEGYYKVIL